MSTEVKNMVVLHKKSTAGSPSSDSLKYGEIAINYKKGNESIFIKNDNDEIVSFNAGAVFNKVNYNEATKKIEFKSNDTTFAELDASLFVKDGMVDNVEIINKKLVISFNSDAGKDEIKVDIGDIFTADNYYTKAEIDKIILELQSGGEIDLDGYATKEWVKENYPQVKYFETVEEFNNGEYGESDIVLVDESNTMYYEEKEFRFVSFRVIDDIDANMRVVVYMKEDQSIKFIDEFEELNKDTMIPIGIEVVPESHDRYGDGSAGVMSLVGMSYLTPDTGKLGDVETNVADNSKDSAMYWGSSSGHGLSYMNKFPHVGVSTGPVNATIQGTCSGNCMLPVDKDTNGKQCLTDRTTYYYNYSDAGRYFGPSPYNGTAANKLYVYDTGGNPLAQFNGKENTETILKNATGQTNWKTDETITNSANAGYFPMACCCWRFHTEGTEQGEWYLPAMGELGYISPRYNKINVAINKVNEVFGKCADILLPCLVQPQNIMSSTLLVQGSVCRLAGWNYNVGSTSPNTNSYARAFIKIKP